MWCNNTGSQKRNNWSIHEFNLPVKKHAGTHRLRHAAVERKQVSHVEGNLMFQRNFHGSPLPTWVSAHALWTRPWGSKRHLLRRSAGSHDSLTCSTQSTLTRTLLTACFYLSMPASSCSFSLRINQSVTDKMRPFMTPPTSYIILFIAVLNNHFQVSGHSLS